jgi:ArsR family transcriptional regulator
MCVCDIAQLLGCSQSLISHQLRLLRQARLVRYEKKGKTSVYMLDDEHVWQIIAMGLRHVQEEHERGEGQ